MRKCAAFLALSMACCIAGSCVIRIKSFQPSRDPIVPETGLGQRAGRFPVFGLHSPGNSRRKFIGAFVRIAQERDAL